MPTLSSELFACCVHARQELPLTVSATLTLMIEYPEEAECSDPQISENDLKEGYLCVPALLSAQCLSMLLHEERAGPCLVPSNRTLHYQNTGMVTDPCSTPSCVCVILSRSTIDVSRSDVLQCLVWRHRSLSRGMDGQ